MAAVARMSSGQVFENAIAVRGSAAKQRGRVVAVSGRHVCRPYTPVVTRRDAIYRVRQRKFAVTTLMCTPTPAKDVKRKEILHNGL